MWVVGMVTFLRHSGQSATTIVAVPSCRKLLERAGRTASSSPGSSSSRRIPAVPGPHRRRHDNDAVDRLARSPRLPPFARSLPSLVSMLIPLAITAYLLRGREVVSPGRTDEDHGLGTTEFERNLMFFPRNRHSGGGARLQRR